jgi:hypothetical protein
MTEEQFEEWQYVQQAMLHMMHRQYEMLLQIANNTGTDVEQISEIVAAHAKAEYQVPFNW